MLISSKGRRGGPGFACGYAVASKRPGFVGTTPWQAESRGRRDDEGKEKGGYEEMRFKLD